MREKIEKFLGEVERIADEIFLKSSIIDKAAEFENRVIEIAEKDTELWSFLRNNFDELQRIYNEAEWRAKWRDMKDEEILAA